MAHYDCDDCGSSLGIAYGHCDNCTPKIVKELNNEYIYQRRIAETEFDSIMKRKKEEFIEDRTRDIREEYKKEYEKHHPRQRR